MNNLDSHLFSQSTPDEIFEVFTKLVELNQMHKNKFTPDMLKIVKTNNSNE